ncbi:hypothetical protein C0J52_27057, partial [Blattella germanica]
ILDELSEGEALDCGQCEEEEEEEEEEEATAETLENRHELINGDINNLRDKMMMEISYLSKLFSKKPPCLRADIYQYASKYMGLISTALSKAQHDELVIIMGDLNCRIDVINQKAEAVLHFLESEGLSLINKSNDKTYISHNRSSTIDLVLTNMKNVKKSTTNNNEESGKKTSTCGDYSRNTKTQAAASKSLTVNTPDHAGHRTNIFPCHESKTAYTERCFDLLMKKHCYGAEALGDNVNVNEGVGGGDWEALLSTFAEIMDLGEDSCQFGKTRLKLDNLTLLGGASFACGVWYGIEKVFGIMGACLRHELH